MKIMAIYKKEVDHLPAMGMMVWPDSALVRNGKTLFLPVHQDGDAKINSTVIFGLGLRIDRLGKSITKKFSSRYYDEVAPVAMIVSERTSEMIMAGKDPLCTGFVADYSVVCGDFISKEILSPDTVFSVRMNSEDNATSYQFNIEHPVDELSECVVYASTLNTLKTGDIIVLILKNKDIIPTQSELRVNVDLNNNNLLNFKLK